MGSQKAVPPAGKKAAEKKWARVKEIRALCAMTAMEPGMAFSFRAQKPLPSLDRRYIGRIGPKTTITLKIYPDEKLSRER